MTRQARPFVKWAGGKTQLLPELRQFYPSKETLQCYHEPFLGGGAVFFDMCASGVFEGKGHEFCCYLSDANHDLMNAYQVVRDDVNSLIEALAIHAEDHLAAPTDHYYEVRGQVIVDDPVKEAARMIYLNKTCFNGLYRVNSKGGFNVPAGKYKNPKICDRENLLACSRELQRAFLLCEPYTQSVENITPGDFVYFDPPYIPVSKTADFTSYTSAGFGPVSQERLASALEKLDEIGCWFLLSQADVPDARRLYEGFNVGAVQARRSINSAGTKRAPVGEIIVYNDNFLR